MSADLTITIAVLDEAAQAAYRAMREVGLASDAAKDAITVHVSETLTGYQRDRGDLAACDDDSTGN